MMNMKCWGAFAVAVAVCVAGCSTDPACGEFPLSDEQRQCVVGTIDDMVHDHYPFAEYKGVDLDEFSQQLWAAAEGDKSDADFLADVNYTLRLLEDAHTRMEQRALEQPAVAPVDIEVGDEVVIGAVDNEQWAHLIGQSVVAVDGIDIDDALASLDGWTEAGPGGELTLSGMELALAGEAGTEVELTLQSGQSVDLQRRAVHDEPEIDRYGDIGYLRLDTFGFVDDLGRIDDAVNELMDTDALMIDLRNNGGGFPSVSDGLFGRLIDEEVPPFRLVDVDGFEDRMLESDPRGDAYQGEVVVLTNNRTYSASNYFAHRMVYHDRGILIGETTGGGAAAPKEGVKLVPGVWFQVSSHVVRTPEGVHSESGLRPEIVVGDGDEEGEPGGSHHPLQVSGDPVKNRALQYLNGQYQKEVR